jgi:hypothetical protein
MPWGRSISIRALLIPAHRIAPRSIYVKPDGTACTTRSGERANSGAPPVLVAFGDYDAVRLGQFAAEHGGALVERWQLFGEASLLEAAE